MAYCVKCKKHIGKNYTVHEERILLLRNKVIHKFNYMSAYCNLCHNKINVKSVTETNNLNYNKIFEEV